MKETFVAGDIQRICEIDKTRYTYVMRQVGIKPETEVEGTGRSHQFSFKNLLQFAFANSALRFLSAKETGKLLGYIDNTYLNLMPNLYDPEKTTAEMYYIEAFEGMYFFCVVGPDGKKLDSWKIFRKKGFPLGMFKKDVQEKMKKALSVDSTLSENHEQHFMINLGLIKKRILKNI